MVTVLNNCDLSPRAAQLQADVLRISEEIQEAWTTVFGNGNPVMNHGTPEQIALFRAVGELIDVASKEAFR